MIASLLSLFALATITVTAYGLGCPVVRGLNLAAEDRLSRVVWSVVIGLMVAGQLLAVCGLLGLLYVVPIRLVSWGLCICTIWMSFRRAARRSDASRSTHLITSEFPRAAPEGTGIMPPPRWLSVPVLVLAGLACFGSLIAALAPPTAGDALCYHLELPKTFLAEHALGFLPDHDNATFPLLVEMWYLWGLALDGGVAAQLVHWATGILFGLSAVVLATPIVGRPWAWLAGAVVVLVPGVSNQMTAPLNDVALAMLTTLTLAAWCRAVLAGENRNWFVLAGLALGGALATKYIALVFSAALAATVVWRFWRRRDQRPHLLRGVAVVSILAASVAGLWYVRAAWHRGNPVYPFLAEVFDSSERADVASRGTLPESKSPLGRHPAGLLSAAWHVTMNPQEFGGRGHQLGVLWLAALPGLLVARRLRGLGMLLAVALVYWVIWFFLRQNVRFLLPIVPLISVAVVWVWIEMHRFPLLTRRLAGTVFALALLAFAAASIRRCRDQATVALGLESRQDYLARVEPTWHAACVCNDLIGPEAHLLSQDYRAFYFQCKVTRENLYRRRTGYHRSVIAPEDLSRQVRQSGFTHLLLAENVSGEGIQYDPTLSRLVDAQLESADRELLVELADYRFCDSDGATRRYRLFRVQ